MDGDAGWYYHSGGSNDWDLNAVVRYACGGRVPPPPSSEDPFSSFCPPQELLMGDGLFGATTSLPNLSFNGGSAVVDELSIAFFGSSALVPPLPPRQQEPAVTRIEETLHVQHDATAPPPMPQTSGRQASGSEGPRSKRKKKLVKKEVKRVAADGMSADPWAWRKYGQKPIKGSPYPRGYYRCSTDKACEARKMVERCRDDPDSFILTYTGAEHSHPAPVHRNSLAGTTRNRQQREHPAGGHGATATAVAAEPSPGKSTSGGMSTSSPRSPSMDMEECNQEETERDEAGGASLTPKDVEMDGEDDELKKLLDTAIGVGVPPLLNVVEETFVVSPWVTAALGDATGWS